MPLSGYWDIATEDGTLRLTMTVGAAADLLIDLNTSWLWNVRTMGDERNRRCWATKRQQTLLVLKISSPTFNGALQLHWLTLRFNGLPADALIFRDHLCTE
jgi:hypothetical protein